ncbi:unnamed protein product, partial [Prorocentrum cordatum]
AVTISSSGSNLLSGHGAKARTSRAMVSGSPFDGSCSRTSQPSSVSVSSMPIVSRHSAWGPPGAAAACSAPSVQTVPPPPSCSSSAEIPRRLLPLAPAQLPRQAQGLHPHARAQRPPRQVLLGRPLARGLAWGRAGGGGHHGCRVGPVHLQARIARSAATTRAPSTSEGTSSSPTSTSKSLSDSYSRSRLESVVLITSSRKASTSRTESVLNSSGIVCRSVL